MKLGPVVPRALSGQKKRRLGRITTEAIKEPSGSYMIVAGAGHFPPIFFKAPPWTEVK